MDPLTFAIVAFSTIASAIVTYGTNKYINGVEEEQFEEQKKLAETSLTNEKSTADKNFELSQQQFEYQKQLNETQMRREDNAMQRQVADLKAAGLSPLMASGGSSTGQYLSASAPQYNSSGIQSALSNLLGVHNDYASRKQMAYQFQRQQHLQTAQAVADLTSLKLDNDFKREQIKAQKIANEYNTEHGIRDPNLQSALVDIVMSYLKEHNINPIEAGQTKLEQAKEGITNQIEEIKSDLNNGTRNTKAGRVIQNVVDVPKTAVEDTIDVAKKTYNGGKKIWKKTKSTARKIGSAVYNGYKSFRHASKRKK